MIPSSITYSTTGAVVTLTGASVAMIALRPLFGDYALEPGGEQAARSISERMKFYTNEDYAVSLESRGLAERYHEPVVRPTLVEAKQQPVAENKMLAPAANKSESADDNKPVRRAAGRPPRKR